jgi:hypothetical protein
VVTLSTSSVSVSATFALIPPPTGSSSVTQEEPTGSSSVTKEEIKRQKKLAKAEKKARKKLAKIERILAKIERKLIAYADNPKAVNRLNRKKVKLLAKQDKIQEKYSIN